VLLLLDLLIPFLPVLDVKVLIQDVVEPLMILLDIAEGLELHLTVLIHLGHRWGETLTPLGFVEGLIYGPHEMHILPPVVFNEIVIGGMLRGVQMLHRLLPWCLWRTGPSQLLVLLVSNSCGILICAITILWHHSSLHK
jgi:hypothetical protein